MNDYVEMVRPCAGAQCFDFQQMIQGFVFSMYVGNELGRSVIVCNLHILSIV